MLTSVPSIAIANYELLELIAQGGMAAVYKGRHRQTGQLVAIKIMPEHLAKNPVLMKRFEQEYAAARAIDHPNIVRALDFGWQDGCPYLVMELVDGESLGKRLERAGVLPVREAIRIVAQVAQGLDRAHKMGLIHRDVKPDNVLLGHDGQAKLTDLGLVKDVVEAGSGLTRTGRGLGTPHFMAPEQFRNARNADARCDIYSLAATMYMMVTGKLPFESAGPVDAWMKRVNNELTHPRQLVPDLSERVDWAIVRGMSLDRNQRPASCREFIEDLTGHSTRKLVSPDGDSLPDLWFMVYNDEQGIVHTAKGSLDGLRRALTGGPLTNLEAVRIGRNQDGPFASLRHYPEFRDLVIVPTPSVSAPTPPPPTNAAPAVSSAASSSSWVIRLPDDAKPPVPPLPAIPLARPVSVAPSDGSDDWAKWLALLFVAVASALAGYYFLPTLLRLLRYLPF